MNIMTFHFKEFIMPSNKHFIKITGYSGNIPIKIMLQKMCLLRNCKEIGDTEVVNNTQLDRLEDNGVSYEITPIN